ncbi:MAG: hypothetical protein IJU69_07645 [Bacteroidales bacterium]|nr:hypothetical protein [Bacteroidales bacterium]
MKRLNLCLAMLLALVSCSKFAAEEQSVEAPSPASPASPAGLRTFVLEAEADKLEGSGSGVKTYLSDTRSVLWGSGEYVYLYYNAGSDKFAQSLEASASASSGKEKASFQFTIEEPSDTYNYITFSGKPSTGQAAKYYSYKNYTKTWRNYCPLCGQYNTLTAHYGTLPHKYAPEGEITCDQSKTGSKGKKGCDADYDVCTGGDKSGSYRAYLTDANGKKNTKSSVNTSIGNASPPPVVTSYTYGGVYPSSARVTSGNTDPAAFKVLLPSAQNASAGAYDPKAYIMLLKPQTVSSAPKTLTATFRRMTALNKLTLTGVKSKIKSVEISAPGKKLSGYATMNLKTGNMVSIYSGSQNITVSFATPLSAGTAQVLFPSWGTEIAAGGKLTITLTCEDGVYSKTITAGPQGIKFLRSYLNLLQVDFFAVPPREYNMRDFASGFAGVLSVWNSTKGTIKVTDGSTFTDVRYIPSTYKFTVGSVSYDRSAAYEIALQGLNAMLLEGKSLSMPIPSSHGYTWGANPYNEEAGNGGVFINTTVNTDFLLNYASRELDFAQDKSRWSNLCTYTNAKGEVSTAGTPQVTGYKGVCCLERNFLQLARFYKYLLDGNIDSDIAAKCKSVTFDASLY